jgi:hypothetical protein
MKTNKKAQMITFDFSSSIIIFMIFIAIFIGLFLLSQTVEKKQEFELEYVFANLEHNLKFDPVSGQDFFRDYRVNWNRLRTFAQNLGDDSIDSYIIGNINGAHGIGLDEANYDVCLYFTDNDKSFITIDTDPASPTHGLVALGWLETNPGSHTGNTCNSKISAKENPCEQYEQAVSVFKPVLFDEGDPINNRILQMNIVMCKR